MEGRRPAADDLRAGRRRSSTRSNFTAANGFNPDGAKGILAAVSTGGIIFALLGFEQADQLAGESENPKRDIPRAVIGAIVIGAIIYILLQIVFLAALPAARSAGHLGDGRLHDLHRPVRRTSRRCVGLGWLATILYIDAVISPGRHRPDLHHRRPRACPTA